MARIRLLSLLRSTALLLTLLETIMRMGAESALGENIIDIAESETRKTLP